MRKTLTILLVFTCTALFAERPGEKWIKSFRLAPDIQAELFADEDQLINPVAINFDLQNNLYVAESLRQGKGVSGSARKKFWAKDDFLIKTFADRYKLHQKYDAMVSMKSMTEVSDQLRVISDNNKDGIADNSRVISADYKELLSGAAAGVTIRDGFAYFTCIPNLYKVNLKSGESEVLASGFGIRIGVHGHDMHAPVWGMDGKLYFNIGDRGFDVKTKEGKHLYSPLQGGVFRCNPDGTQLELFHEGVRNPQGMQFDQFGNLFTVDNDMGAGDKCRVLFLGEGGDSGWNASNQIFRTFRNEFGLIQHKILPPWISEKLWMQPHENQPAWINPAAGHLTNGPSGMEYYPGSGFSAKYKDSFFICDHRGSAARSSIFSFKLEDSGAGFNMTNKETVVANLLASDVSFGYDGKLYACDWIGGGNGTGTGRVYAFSGEDTKKAAYPTKALSEYASQELVTFLSHDDKRIRLFSQFELVKRNEFEALLNTALTSNNTLARLHGIWGLGQLANCTKLIPLLNDKDPNIRAQTAKVLGENLVSNSGEEVYKLINDLNMRVRYHALFCLGKLRFQKALPEVLNMLASLKKSDPILRQGASYYLSQLSDIKQVLDLAQHSSIEIRLNAVLALRKLAAPQITQFLGDSEPVILNEVIGAIYDKNIEEALPAVADFLNNEKVKTVSAFNQIRILNANFKIGSDDNAKNVLKFAVSENLDEAVRLEALSLLLNWQNESLLDRVLWTPIHRPESKLNSSKELIFKTISSYSEKPNKHKNLCQKIIYLYSPELSIAQMEEKIKNDSLNQEIRLDLVHKLLAKKGYDAKDILLSLIKTKDKEIHKLALSEYSQQYSKSSDSILLALYNQKSYKDKGFLLDLMKQVQTPEIDKFLITKMQESKEPEFELIEAVKASKNPTLNNLYQGYLSKQKDSLLAPYSHTLKGGSIRNGKVVFNNSAAQCIRCHKVGNTGGVAGPDLSKISSSNDKTYLLESLVNPNAKIAPGFGTVLITLKDGGVKAGVLHKESEKTVELKDMEGKTVSINKKNIKEQTKPISGMPPMASLLSPKELRDLIAYLGSLK